MQAKLNPQRTVTQDAYTKLLCHFDGLDGATSYNAATGQAATFAGTAQLDTAQYKFGTASLLLDGNSDYINFASSTDFAFGTGDFTIEFWFRLNAKDAQQFLFDQRPASTNGLYPALYVTSSNYVSYYVNNANRIDGNILLTTDTWYHCALARSGTTTKMFINGVQNGSDYSDSNNYINGTSRPIIGVDGVAVNTGYLNGWIDEVRISKGIARWTANFTPPNAAYHYDMGGRLYFPGFQEILDFTSAGTESSVSVTVDGDTDKEYQIYYRNQSSSQNILLNLNSDAGSNYGYQYIDNSSGSISGGRGATTFMGSANYPGFENATLLTPTGFIKTLFTAGFVYSSGTTISNYHILGRSWNSTANVISLNFSSASGNFTSGTRITVYARRSTT